MSLSSPTSFKFPKLDNFTIGTIVFILVLLGITLYYFKYNSNYTFNHNLEHSSANSKSNQSNQANQAELILFSVDWCPYCKKAQPIWDELKTEYENKTINGYTILFTEINCTNETPEVDKMINKYKIEGYPTIKLLKDGNVIEYDAKPSKSTLEQFLNTVL